MYEDPEQEPTERSFNADDRVKDKTDEFRMHAELAAVFEGCRKFEAELKPGLDLQIARDVQQTVARLEKNKITDSPIIKDESTAEAVRILNLPETAGMSTNDYHIHRRPGEVMMIRWLEGDQVDSFYKRLQAHFDAGFGAYCEEQRTDQEWKKDPQTLSYLAALDAAEVKMPDRYLRDAIQKHRIFVQSTQTADEMNIAHLVDYIMGMPAAEVVGVKSAPPDEPTERDLTWFFKLFSLRGIRKNTEKMCFFTFLQKSDDEFD